MKKKILILALVLLISVIRLDDKKQVKAIFEEQPYQTKIIGLNYELVNANLAFDGVSILNPDFLDPTDIYIDDKDMVYISDKGRHLIYKYDTSSQTFSTLGENLLKGPTGICIGSDNNIYVADYDAKKIIVLNQNGELVKEINKPTSALYGVKNDFRPTKVSVDKALNIYITCEGNTNGVVRISHEGEFMGYYAPNNIRVNFKLLFKRLFLSKEDRDVFASLKPKASTNLFVDNRNVLYTIIDNEATVSLKKFNIDGTNILSGTPFYSRTYQDVTVDNSGFIYTIDRSKDGCITMMDNNGTLLFRFGTTISNSMKMGQFDGASGIATDSTGNIWALDRSGKNLQVFMKTEFANQIIKAKQAYNNGDYDEAKVLFLEILKENSNFVDAYRGLGEIAMRERDFKTALNYFKLANDPGYSDAYWELRDNFIGKNLLIFVITIILIILYQIFNVKRYVLKIIPDKVYQFNNKVKQNTFVQELRLLPQTLKKPFDVFYDIKFKQKVRFRSAFILLFIFILIMILSDYVFSGFLFRMKADNFNLFFEFFKWGLAIFLFTISNHLISSLQNGEGFYKDIFIGVVYALAPLIIFYLPLAVISNVLTYNEAFLYNFAKNILYIWSIINLIIMIKSIQNYTLGQFIVNIILTVITMMILIFIALIVYILFMQFFDFIKGIVSEVFLT